jgi:hypothetical protein
MPQPDEFTLTGPEGRTDRPVVRVALRLLKSSRQIERELRKRLRRRFGTSPAPVDRLAQPPHGRRVGRLGTPFPACTAGVPAARRKAAR